MAIAGPAVAAEPAYVGSAACTDCHEAEAAAWAGSHHALAWTEATPANVLADFDGTRFSHDGVDYRFRLEAGGHFVTVTEADGTATDHRIHSVAGVAPLQQYLIETEPGRIQSFDVVWDVVRGRWYHLYPDQHLPPGDGLHWTGPYKTWNARCAECHATGFEKNYDRRTGRYASVQAEIGVGCEACHGPGEAHLDWAAGRPPNPAFAALGALGLTMRFGEAEATIQQCAGCHSRREAHGDGNPLPGTPYHDAYNMAQLRRGLYHADGQILDEVYVYGSFLQSKMYARGVSCLDCHDAHDATLRAEGNAVCTQCHGPSGNPAFPTLRQADYDSPAHHFHETGTPGAQCASCHMTERAYMGIDLRRDHSFRIPRPDLASETGAPDACTGCHADRDAAWAAAQVEAWYPAGTHRRAHFGEAFAAGRLDPRSAGNDLLAVASDPAQAGIVRATALWLLETAGAPGFAERTAALVADPDPLVRAAAVGLQRAAPPRARVDRVSPALSDPVRSVRIAAARALIGMPAAAVSGPVAGDLRRARGDWQASLSNRFDFPETHLQLAGMALTSRNLPAANAAFREAVRMDPQRVDAWSMIVRIEAATRGPAAAAAALDEALALNPGDATLRALGEALQAR
ncbi:multiheme c-type cytochrome [Paralimibaculum aggregatum]|uniref:Multiheme c-type cytochrome n=1 Tax=Paralimibaculum aggregatum TaxID=3036245 RepID=A0ABQ6LSS7_9RHOB|nr:multiheme c-type cytochrome [Limibaculum sp. NKW23]GMG85122.1 multiheme c-type cytochrome [Limibaculum sp. NKW23]